MKRLLHFSLILILNCCLLFDLDGQSTGKLPRTTPEKEGVSSKGIIDFLNAIDTGKIETVTTGSGNNQHSSVRTAYDRLIHISNPYEVYKYFQTALTNRQESLYSGRADTQNNPVA